MLPTSNIIFITYENLTKNMTHKDKSNVKKNTFEIIF